MRTEKWLVLCFVLLLVQLVACERSQLEENAPAPVSARTNADSIDVDSIKTDTIKIDSIKIDSVKIDSVKIDTIKTGPIPVDSVKSGGTNVGDSIKVDSTKAWKLKHR